MDSQISSLELSFVDFNGVTIDEPYEWMRARLLVGISTELWNETQVFLNELPLDVSLRFVRGVECIVADWPHSIGPGFHTIAVTTRTSSWRHSVKLRSSKLSDEQFLELLEDLQNRLPTSIILSLKRMGALGHADYEEENITTKAQELEKLKRAVIGDSTNTGLIQILNELSRKCHEGLAATYQHVPLYKARRPARSNLPALLNRARNEERLNQTILDYRVESTYDTHENRVLKTYVEAVLRRIKVLYRKFPREHFPGESSLLDSLLLSLAKSYHHADFLRGVSCTKFGLTKSTMVLLRNPLYKAAWIGYLNFFRRLNVELDDPALDSPLAKLDYLYQRWCVMLVINKVIEVCARLGFSATSLNLLTEDETGVFFNVLVPGREVVELTDSSKKLSISIFPEPTYSRSSNRFRCPSYSQIPDLAIEIRGAKASRIVISLDSNYQK